MPVLGFREGWALPCSLNLASCRLRAEALARQLNAGLWASRSCQGSPGDSGCVSPVVVDRPPRPSDGPEGFVLLPPTATKRETFGACKEESQLWRPDSPPESSTSESPALTIEVDSAETLSELASPTFDVYPDEGGPLADELRSRLRLIQSEKGELEEEEEASLSSSSSRDLLSPEACPRLVRSTSLKTGKTPPGTPSRKKIVRFADVLGLDLEAVRHFAKDDDAPVVPQSAFADLGGSAPRWGPASTTAGRRLSVLFEQPGADPRFLDRVRQQRVCLEDAVVQGLRVTGVVRVLNLGFEKLVQVRHTATEWASHADLTADYVPGSCDGFSDRFRFQLDMSHLNEGRRLLFAIRYVANGQEFWDNNSGENYALLCEERGSEPDSSFMHHFL